jgi:hypothetical protein
MFQRQYLKKLQLVITNDYRNPKNSERDFKQKLIGLSTFS